jgi:hypothetical protein
MEQYPEHPSPHPEEIFEQHRNVALDGIAAIQAALHRLGRDGKPKTWEHVEDMERIAEELQQMAEFLGV